MKFPLQALALLQLYPLECCDIETSQQDHDPEPVQVVAIFKYILAEAMKPSQRTKSYKFLQTLKLYLFVSVSVCTFVWYKKAKNQLTHKRKFNSALTQEHVGRRVCFQASDQILQPICKTNSMKIVSNDIMKAETLEGTLLPLNLEICICQFFQLSFIHQKKFQIF